ncbi:DUF732 domain-containing protein [Mycolicibacter longobardus]|uniref:DUF732 domain-containing protein n=1 Tax=Mycolicibacter longobardus TaxID=1108812 RepID=UPI001F45C468|nr:DUF732 domain-containing protein [Mycolicibacter longobardus]
MDGIRDARSSAARRSTSAPRQRPGSEADRRPVPTQRTQPEADEFFIETLKARGLTIKDRPGAITMGHEVCTYLGTHSKQQTIDVTYEGQEERPDKPDKTKVTAIVETSILAYCPQHSGR